MLIRHYHRWVRFERKHVHLGSQFWSPRSRVRVWWRPFSYRIRTLPGRRHGAGACFLWSSPSSPEATIFNDGSSTLMTSSNPNRFPVAPPPNTSPGRNSCLRFGGHWPRSDPSSREQALQTRIMASRHGWEAVCADTGSGGSDSARGEKLGAKRDVLKDSFRNFRSPEGAQYNYSCISVSTKAKLPAPTKEWWVRETQQHGPFKTATGSS